MGREGGGFKHEQNFNPFLTGRLIAFIHMTYRAPNFLFLFLGSLNVVIFGLGTRTVVSRGLQRDVVYLG